MEGDLKKMQTNVSLGHMTHSFQNYPVGNKPRSGFNRSSELITSFDGGYLIPIWWKQAYPGDTLDMSIAAFVRMATMISPFMTPIYMDIHVWCVPNRLVWNHWVNFCGEQLQPQVYQSYLTPQLTTPSGGVSTCSVYDYCGIRPGVAGISFNSFLFRAMALTYNEWYRDENLQQFVPFTDADSGDTLSDYYLYKRGKRKDYFTGALPFTQKGTSVNLPLGLEAPVVFNSANTDKNFRSQFLSRPTIFDSSGNRITAGTNEYTVGYYTRTAGALSASTTTTSPGTSVPNSAYYSAYADLSNASGATIQSLYDAIAIQTVLQNDALHGSRYIEMILGSFGVKSSDARLQRPEFLGGGHFTMDMQVIPQTGSTDSTSPQGNLVANGIISGTTKRIVKSFEEHCICFAYVNVRVPYYYQYGLDKEFSRHSRYDYYRPELANISEQAILNKEIYAQGASVVDSNGDIIDEQVFGYQEAWADLRYSQSRITGLMRSGVSGSLDVYHLAEARNSLPALNSQWIEEDNTIYNRVLAVQATPSDPNISQFLGNFAFDEKWYRVMPVYSIPGIQKLGGL